MLKRLIFIVIFLFLPFYFAYASILINEVMYDLKDKSDDGREWIEVYNAGDKVVDLSTYKFFEADTNHKLIPVQGGASLKAKSYALIVDSLVKFKEEWSQLFSGTPFIQIFESSFSLSNDGEVLTIKNKSLDVVDQYFYDSKFGGAGDGKSLQKINGLWTGALPTPGTENKISSTTNTSTITKTKSSSTSTKTFVKKSENVLPEDISSDVNTEETPVVKEGRDFPIFFVIILIILVGFGAGTVYWIRQSKIKPKTGDDFEILGE